MRGNGGSIFSASGPGPAKSTRDPDPDPLASRAGVEVERDPVRGVSPGVELLNVARRPRGAERVCSMLVNPRILQAVATHAAKEKSRYALNGILLARVPGPVVDGDLPGPGEAGAPVLVGTDGRRLLKVSWREEYPAAEFPAGPNGSSVDPSPAEGFKALLPVAKMKEVSALPVKGKTVKPILGLVAVEENTEPDRRSVRFAGTDLESYRTVNVREAEGAFPQYDEVIPKGDPVAEVCVNPEFLAEACKAAADACGLSEVRSVTVKLFKAGRQDGPITVEARSAEGVEVVALVPRLIFFDPEKVELSDAAPEDGNGVATAVVMPINLEA